MGFIAVRLWSFHCLISVPLAATLSQTHSHPRPLYCHLLPPLLLTATITTPTSTVTQTNIAGISRQLLHPTHTHLPRPASGLDTDSYASHAHSANSADSADSRLIDIAQTLVDLEKKVARLLQEKMGDGRDGHGHGRG